MVPRQRREGEAHRGDVFDVGAAVPAEDARVRHARPHLATLEHQVVAAYAATVDDRVRGLPAERAVLSSEQDAALLALLGVEAVRHDQREWHGEARRGSRAELGSDVAGKGWIVDADDWREGKLAEPSAARAAAAAHAAAGSTAGGGRGAACLVKLACE